MTRLWWSAALTSALLVGCSTDGNRAVLADEASEEQSLSAANALIQSRFDDFAIAAAALRDAAPADHDGWNAASAPASLTAMRAAWRKARAAYTAVEVPASTLFPELHHRLDTDYDDLLADGADGSRFDNHGVIGLQAVERILWADVIPAPVKAHEAALANDVAARFPGDASEAAAIKNELLGQLAADAEALRDGFHATKLDVNAAYSTTTLALQEQLGQLVEAAKGEGKARYAGVSLANLRSDLAATREMYALFRPWILAKSGGAHTDEEVGKAFTRLTAAYDKPPGDNLPLPPANWRTADPSDAMLATAFGLLFAAAQKEADPSIDGTLCFEMAEGADLLGVTAAY
ncbi:MAG: imelysin family protein [Byssovorax sp.]